MAKSRRTRIDLQEENVLLREQLALLKEEENAFESIGAIIADNLADMGKINDARRQAIASSRKLGSISEKIAANDKEGAELSAKQLKTITQQSKLELGILKQKRSQSDLTADEAKSLDDIIEKSEALVKLAKERADQEADIEQAGGAALNTLKGIGGLLKKAGFGDLSEKLNFKGAIKDATVFDIKTKKASVDNTALAKNLATNVKGLIGPAEAFLFVATQIGKALKRADKNVVNLRRSFQLSASEAIKVNNSFAATALRSGDVTANVESLTEANQAINDELGIQVRYQDDLLVGVNALIKRNKISAEAATAIAKQTLATGNNFDDVLTAAFDVSAELQNQSGITLNSNKLLEETSKISGQLRANLSRTPEGLVKAVAQAKLLGMEMEGINSIAESLLDFESSISAELEAEVLTGKQLNLEQARLLALQGKNDEAAAEVVKQMGSLAEFQQMNVIQQKAIAQAAGLTTDQLATSLEKQAAINSQKQEGLDIDGETEKANASALSVQERLASAVEKLNSTLQASLAIVGAIVGLIAFALAPVTGGLSLAAFAGIGAGLGLGATALVNDGIAPSSKGPFTITDAYGATAVTAKGDGVVVSPNISQGGGGSGITKAQANEMISLLKVVASKDFSINMDGRKLNSAMQTSGVSYNV